MNTIIVIFVMLVFLIGIAIGLVITLKERKKIIAECEKWKRLYKKELNNWKNKYDNDNYEAY